MISFGLKMTEDKANICNTIDLLIEQYSKPLNTLKIIYEFNVEKTKRIDFEIPENDIDDDFSKARLILGFYYLITIEVLIIQKNWLNAVHPWEKKVCIRRLYLVIKETLDQNSKYGKLIHKYVEDKKELIDARKKIYTQIGKNNLNAVRNTDAHFSFDIFEYATQVAKIGNIDFVALIRNFGDYMESTEKIALSIIKTINQQKDDEIENLRQSLNDLFQLKMTK